MRASAFASSPHRGTFFVVALAIACLLAGYLTANVVRTETDEARVALEARRRSPIDSTATKERWSASSSSVVASRGSRDDDRARYDDDEDEMRVVVRATLEDLKREGARTGDNKRRDAVDARDRAPGRPPIEASDSESDDALRRSLEDDVCAALKRNRSDDLPYTEDKWNLNVYPSRDGSREFVLCASAKTGCSQWVMLLNYLWNGKKIVPKSKSANGAGDESSLGDIHLTGARQATVVKSDSAVLRDASVPRILIMRDPYERTVSSYHDFRRRNAASDDAAHRDGLRVPRYQSRHTSTPFNSASDAYKLHPDVALYGTTLRNVTFEEFIVQHVQGDARSAQNRDHRSPISDHCSIKTWRQRGWDYVLQLEQMSLWLPCVLRTLRLEDVVRSGWYGDSSLFNVPDRPTVQDVIRVALGGSDAKRAARGATKAVVIGHEAPDDEDLHTRATIEIVNRVFHDDFVIGGYKLRES